MPFRPLPKFSHGGFVGNAITVRLSYSENPANYTAGSAITSNIPTVTGGTPLVSAAYSVSPSFPTGLSFNTTTGVLSGTPSSAAPYANFLVTVSTDKGHGAASIRLAISPPARDSTRPGGVDTFDRPDGASIYIRA